jgi:hypothetical protein
MYELLQRYGLWAVFFGTMIEGDLTLLLSVRARPGFTFEEAFSRHGGRAFVGDCSVTCSGLALGTRPYLAVLHPRAPRVES